MASPLDHSKEVESAHHVADFKTSADHEELQLMGATSPGVRRMEAISAHLTLFDRIFLFVGVFLIAYAYSLDATVRYTFQTTATASFGHHSLLASVNVVRSVIAAVGQPTASKIADVFGRVELVLFSIFFYVLGTIIEAASNNVATFCAGAVLYQEGPTSARVLNLPIMSVGVVLALEMAESSSVDDPRRGPEAPCTSSPSVSYSMCPPPNMATSSSPRRLILVLFFGLSSPLRLPLLWLLFASSSSLDLSSPRPFLMLLQL